MKKCTICKFGSWVVGLATLKLVFYGLMGWSLPTGWLAMLVYLLVGITTVCFLYYQIVPCPRCVAANKPASK